MLRIIAILFVISIFIPVEFFTMAGSIRIETYRIVLALAMIYALLNLNQVIEQANLVDILLICLILLAFCSFWYNHSLQKAVESTGLYILETLGAFYLARLFLITPSRYFYMNQAFILLILAFSLITFYEAFAHHRILHEMAERITGNHSLDPRLYTADYIRAGLLRVTSVFAHPILFGTLAALFFPFAFILMMRMRTFRNTLQLLSVVASMLLTLSSAPLLSLIFQGIGALLVKFWDTARRFWIAIFFAAMAAAMLMNLLSNRGFFGILISYLTFNPNTGYFRMLQWEHSMDDILENPILGIAHNDWTRPYWQSWLGDSIDSFWLLLTLQHGLFASVLLFIACLYAVFNLLNRVNLFHESVRWMATAWILSFMSLILIGFTVDYFGKLQPLFFFMLGATRWATLHLQNQPPPAAAPLTENRPS